MNPIKIYVRAISAILIAFFGWGFLAPPLVSSPTDIGLLAGVLVVVAVPVAIYLLFKPFLKTKNKENEEN
jgi:uncharacterized membrane protein (DUF485 family)